MINCADKDICNSDTHRHFLVKKWEDELKAEKHFVHENLLESITLWGCVKMDLNI